MTRSRNTSSVNITRIAAETGLSIASVSRAMNGRNGVSEEVRHRVNELLRKYNYVANSHLNRDKKIAVLLDTASFGSYLAELYRGFSVAASEQEIEFCTVNYNRDGSRSLLKDVREQQCSGVIVTLPELFLSRVNELLDSELRIILIDASAVHEKVGFINHDSMAGSRDAARHLLGLGHVRIGYLRHPSGTLNHLQRFKGYEHALSEAGIEPDPGWIVTGGVSYQENCRAAVDLLTRHPELSAVMTTNDDLALSVLRAAWELGRRVPAELSVVGFDDVPQSACLTPALTTVHHPIYETAYSAMCELNQCLRDSKRPLPQEILPVRPVIRESTAKCSITTNC